MSNVVYPVFNKDQREFQEYVDSITAQLEGEPPVAPENFYRNIEKNFMEDPSRRIALMFLERPFAVTSDGIKQDRETALAFAKVAECLNDSIAFAKNLESILTKAQNRIRAALGRREDA
jgi:hypothetical protein